MSPCPSADTLAQFAVGGLGGDPERQLAQHVQGCTACAGKLFLLESTGVTDARMNDTRTALFKGGPV